MGTFWVLKGESDKPQENKELHHVSVQEIIDCSHLLPCDFEFALKQKAKILLISPDLIFIYKTRDQDDRKNPELFRTYATAEL